MPLIILVDYGFSVYEANHFMVVTGYTKSGVLVNSGKKENQEISEGELARIWKKTTTGTSSSRRRPDPPRPLLASCTFPQDRGPPRPSDAAEHVNLGVSYENSGELDAALKEYKAAAKKCRSPISTWATCAFSRNALATPQSRIRRPSRRRIPPEAYNNLAWLYYATTTTWLKRNSLP